MVEVWLQERERWRGLRRAEPGERKQSWKAVSSHCLPLYALGKQRQLPGALRFPEVWKWRVTRVTLFITKM